MMTVQCSSIALCASDRNYCLYVKTEHRFILYTGGLGWVSPQTCYLLDLVTNQNAARRYVADVTALAHTFHRLPEFNNCA
jgi:hypothetical protein